MSRFEGVQARRLFAEARNERQAEGSCLMRMGEILKESNATLAKTLLEEVSRFSGLIGSLDC